MSVTEEPAIVIEETELDLKERSGPSPWLVLGIIGVILAVVFGVRRASAQRLAAREAIPTEIGDIGDPAAEANGSGA